MMTCEIGTPWGVALALSHFGALTISGVGASFILWRTFHMSGAIFRLGLLVIIAGALGRIAGFIEDGCRTVPGDEWLFTFGVMLSVVWIVFWNLRGQPCRPCIYHALLTQPQPAPVARPSSAPAMARSRRSF